MEDGLVSNDRCMIRDAPCGRFFGASSLGFVACSSSPELGLELEVVRTVLREFSVEPYIAVDNFDPARDIFCEKICTKIIEARFCVAFLNDVPVAGSTVSAPNPNVYYEYGLMIALRKLVIPLIKKGGPLAFNIQSLDSIIYEPSTLRSQFAGAVESVLGRVQESVPGAQKLFNAGRTYGRLAELKGRRVRSEYRMPKPWDRVLEAPFWLEGASILVADLTHALSIRRILTETTILLNRLADRRQQLEASLAAQSATERSRTRSLERSRPYVPYNEVKASTWQSRLQAVDNAEIVLLIPDGWGAEVTRAYDELEHPLKPPLSHVERREIVKEGVEAGLLLEDGTDPDLEEIVRRRRLGYPRVLLH